MLGIVATAWALLGITALLGNAVLRLGATALATFDYPLVWYHYVIAIVWLIYMGYSEAYRGFYQNFSPRVAARLKFLRHNPTPLRAILAPLFCIGYFEIERRTKIVVYALTLMIVVLIIVVRQLSQPWRGIVDMGVSAGLAMGLLTLFYFVGLAFTGRLDRSPQLPGRDGGARGGARAGGSSGTAGGSSGTVRNIGNFCRWTGRGLQDLEIPPQLGKEAVVFVEAQKGTEAVAGPIGDVTRGDV